MKFVGWSGILQEILRKYSEILDTLEFFRYLS